MKIAFLIRGEKTKNAFADTSLPDGVERKIGTYEADGGDLYFIDFSVSGETLLNARKLASLREDLPSDEDVRMLRDEVSAKFCDLLYPHFCRFEKGLREAITIAMCAEQGNFDDKHVIELEEQFSLEALYNALFVDSQFVKDARNLTKGSFTREKLQEELGRLNETLLWDVLFGTEDMPTLRKNRAEIKDRRNDVMHYHKITEDVFDSTRDLMKEVNDEIGQYLDRVRDDISYPKAKAGDAKMAAKMISESYANMLEGMRASLDVSSLVDLSEISRIAAASVDTSAMDSLTRLAANASNSGISYATQRIMNQQAIGLSANVTKALTSIQSSMPQIDIGVSSAMKRAIESLGSSQSSTMASIARSFSGAADYYQSLIPRDAFDQVKLAASTSMDFSAGLGMGTALSQAMKSTGTSNPGESFDSTELPGGSH